MTVQRLAADSRASRGNAGGVPERNGVRFDRIGMFKSGFTHKVTEDRMSRGGVDGFSRVSRPCSARNRLSCHRCRLQRDAKPEALAPSLPLDYSE